jgi:hypothetical protein
VDGILLQDWVSLSIGSGVVPAVITQGADQWFDANTVNDAVFYLDVKQADSGITINYQTAPRREDAAFVTMVSVPLTVTTRADAVIASTATVPVSRFIRWQLSFVGMTTAGATFRLWLATYSLG